MSYISDYKGTEIDNSVALTQKIIDVIYPVGSIYMSVNNVSPANFLGGTWTALQDRVLIGAGNSYAVNSTGGSTTHTHTSAAHTHTTAGHVLTVNEMPSHTHTITKNAEFTVANGQGSGVSGIPAGQSGWGSYSSAHWFSIGCSSNGGGASHSHGNTGSTTPGNTGTASTLPPYLAVYMWKRTA